MIRDARHVILDAWWWSTLTGLAIVAAVVGFNLLGDGLSETLDPALRGK